MSSWPPPQQLNNKTNKELTVNKSATATRVSCRKEAEDQLDLIAVIRRQFRPDNAHDEDEDAGVEEKQTPELSG